MQVLSEGFSTSRFYQQILWVFLQKGLESTHFSPSTGTTVVQAMSPFHLAALDHDTSLLPASTLSNLYSTQSSLSSHQSPVQPGLQPTGLPTVPQIYRHFLPQGLCTCSVCYLEYFPTRYPPGGSLTSNSSRSSVSS